MSKRRKKSAPAFEFKGFVNLEFGGSDRQLIADWITAFKPDVTDSLVVLAEGGYKVGVSYNDYHDAFHVAITCKIEGSKYAGRCFTLVHADPGRGVNVMRYFYDGHLKSEAYELEEVKQTHDW